MLALCALLPPADAATTRAPARVVVIAGRQARASADVVVPPAHNAPGDTLLVANPADATALHGHVVDLYRDGRIAAGWQDYSWAPHALGAPAPAGVLGHAIRVTFKPWSGIYLHSNAPVDARGGGYVQVELNGGDAGGQHIALALDYGKNVFGTQVSLAPWLPHGVLPARTWVAVRLPIHASLPAGAFVRGVVVQEWSGKQEPPMYIGSVTLRATSLAGATMGSAALAVNVDATAGRHAISPYIYGMAGDDGAAYLRALRPALLRWGGNPSSRFNWQIGHAWNTGSDYFYHNENYAGTSGSASDRFVARAKAAGAASQVTIPTLGWVAKDTTSFSFPGPHGEPTKGQGASCTNPVVKADPRRTSIPVGPGFMQAWVRHLVSENGGVRFFAMDNEPDLWGATHYDVHPTCTGYDEIYHEFTTYASAVKRVAPHSMVTGPVSCCWQFYFHSMLGDADRLRHDNMAFLPWFLQSVHRYDRVHHGRTLDVLDIHYYPEGSYNNLADNVTAAWRLQQTRSLWDPNYVDHSWITQPIQLIPRMQGLIGPYYPGTRFGISEWNWGAEGTLNGALAVADVLGIYGQQGVYMAAYWNHPPAGSPAALGFQLFRDYDGHGASFGETSVRATSSNGSRLSVYASLRRRDGHLLVLLVNKMPSTAAATTLDLRGFRGKIARVYRYDAANLGRVVRSGSLAVQPHMRLQAPPYSISLLDIAP